MGESRQPLFDDFQRTNAAPSTHQESSFQFLNRIAGDYWEHPRALMQEWLDRIPSEQEYNDLRQRFRSRDDEQFRNAFLELGRLAVTPNPRTPRGVVAAIKQPCRRLPSRCS